jgi:hypothetical protein
LAAGIDRSIEGPSQTNKRQSGFVVGFQGFPLPGASCGDEQDVPNYVDANCATLEIVCPPFRDRVEGVLAGRLGDVCAEKQRDKTQTTRSVCETVGTWTKAHAIEKVYIKAVGQTSSVFGIAVQEE